MISADYFLGLGSGGLLAACGVWLAKRVIEQAMRERLSGLEAQLRAQSEWLAARLSRADARRARVLSKLHTMLDDAHYFNDQYIGSCEAGNPPSRVEVLRRDAIRSWMRFDRSFDQAEIFLSEDLAARIRTYGEAMARVRVRFDQVRREVPPDSDLETKLAPLSNALESLSKLRTDVRPQLVKEFRAALGSDSLGR